MSELTIIDETVEIRDAVTQFELAGRECAMVEPLDRFYLVDGKGGRCLMLPSEWAKYQRLATRWQEMARDVPEPGKGAEGAEQSSLARCFAELEELIRQYHLCLHEEDREDMVVILQAKLTRMKTAVLRAEEIWHEEVRA